MSQLPALREELILHPGPVTSDGAPTWSLQDPVRNLFFRIDWLTYELLSRWDLNHPSAILAAVAQETTINPEADDLITVINFLSANELIQRHQADSSWYWQQIQLRHTNWWRWLLHHYLFFRIPLWRPDDWLTRIAPVTQIFYTRTFLLLTVGALWFGVLAISRQWEQFISTLVDRLSWSGIIQYAVALIFIKLLHELGHACTAKRYGCRVPTMGIAFLVMFPMAYTDVNEAWKLRARRQRLAVGAAGMVVELAMAAWSTLAWTLLPDGQLRDSAFLLATTTWISTMAINISPFMRFDGYFLLMDWLDMPNLHTRTFAWTRWWLRKQLFGLNDDPPEYFTRSRSYGLLLFAMIIWLYRLIIFSSIAMMVYFWFPKPLGPILAAVEIGWFIVLPILSELNHWRELMSKIITAPRTWLTLTLLGLMVIMVMMPWDRRITAQGLLRPIAYAPIVVPGAAQIQSLLVTDGALVNTNDKLMILTADALAFQQQSVAARVVSLRWQAATASMDPKLRERQTILQEETHKAKAEFAALSAEQARYIPLSPLPGKFFVADPYLQVGAWLGKNELLGVVADTSQWLVETYLAEADLERIQIGDVGRFYAETPDTVRVALQIIRIDHDAVHDLPDGILAITRGGALLARESNDKIIPETALYRVTAKLVAAYSPTAVQILRGQVVFFGTPKAIMAEFMQAAVALFIRESNF